MCGFFGFSINDSLEKSLKVGEECLKAISHRGPDFQNLQSFNKMIVGHARLSIIDLSESANQPFNYEYLTILFNGEIFNYQILKKELLSLGFSFKTNSDTEVIAAAYLKWGNNCFSRFDGMFAISLFDKKDNKLILARDIFGEKPLYYYLENNEICFSSELSTFKFFLNDLKINLDAMVHFLRIGYILNPLTPFQDINLLKPAHILEINLTNYTSSLKEYFSYADCFRVKNNLKINDVVEKTSFLLTKAIEKRLIGDVPFGTLLSGGLDSSGIFGIINKKLNIKSPSYTIGFKDKNYDESLSAQELCKHFNSHNDTIFLDDIKINDVYEFLSRVDYINFDSSAFPLYLLAKQASKNVKFVLSGDGGDEIFGGYSTYKASFINDKIKNVIPFFNLFPLQNLSSLILKNDNVGILTKISRFILGMDSNTKKAHFNWRLVNTLDEIAEVLKGSNREFIADMDPYHLFSSYYSEVSDLENLDQYLYIDSKTWLTDNNLIKTDRATMLSGLEVRSPYLDKDLVTFLASCPVKFKKDKLILKEVLKSVLPTEVIKRKKRGFNAPVSSWYNINTDEYKFYTNLIFNHKFKLLLEKSV